MAVTKGAAAGSILVLVEGTLKMMAWLKAKTVIGVGAVVIIAADLTMRELGLEGTLYLSFGLLLCLGLPMIMKYPSPRRYSGQKIVHEDRLDWASSAGDRGFGDSVFQNGRLVIPPLSARLSTSLARCLCGNSVQGRHAHPK